MMCLVSHHANKTLVLHIEKAKPDGSWAYGVSCLEYAKFDKFGIADGSHSSNSVSGGRLECTMQNIAGNLVNSFSSRCSEGVEEGKSHHRLRRKESPSLHQIESNDKYADGTHDDENEEIENAIFESIHNELEGEDVRTLDMSEDEISNMAASDIVRSSTSSLEAENGQHADKYRKLEEVYERKIVELKEDEKKLELMRKEFVNERANLVEDTVRKILEKLPPEVARLVLT
ncbi:transposase, Ptta/En/Spm [Tanacetum coccineum]